MKSMKLSLRQMRILMTSQLAKAESRYPSFVCTLRRNRSLMPASTTTATTATREPEANAEVYALTVSSLSSSLLVA